MEEKRDMKVIALDNTEAVALFSAYYQQTHIALPCIKFDIECCVAYFPNGSVLTFIGDKEDDNI